MRKESILLDTDFILIQAPMVTSLKLAGYDLLVFAIIHGFSKDGLHRYKGSAEHIAEKWLGDRKKARTVKDCIKALTEAGYINKYKESHGRMSINTYDTNYSELLAKVLSGEEIPAIGRKRRNIEDKTSGTVPPVVQYHETSGTVPPETSGTVPHNNYIINIYKDYSLVPAEADSKEEEEQFFKLFFFKNAAKPRQEVTEFYKYNIRTGWQDKKGRVFDTFEKRLALADSWKFQVCEGERCYAPFLDALRRIYCLAVEASDEFAPQLLDPKFTGKISGDKLLVRCTQAEYEWMLTKKEAVLPILMDAAGKYQVEFKRQIQ